MESIDWGILNWIVKLRESNVNELVKVSNSSRSSVYVKLKILEDLSVIENKKGEITLKRNSLTQNIIDLLAEGFPVGYLKGRRTELLLNLLDQSSIKELSKKMHIRENQMYKYLHHLYPLLSKEKDRYSINPKNKKLIEMLKSLKKQIYFTDEIILCSVDEGILKKVLKNSNSDGVLTGFSKFTEYGVDYYTIHDYLWYPEKKLTLEEIFVHAIRASENANMLAIAIIFYLKNQEKMELIKIENYAKKFNVLELWYDIQAYLNDEPLKNEEWFLPLEEFNEKCRLYKVFMKSKYRQNNILTLFSEIGDKIKGELKVYILGGVSLMLLELKNATKDIDILLKSKKEFNKLKFALNSIGFKESITKSSGVETATVFNKENYPAVDVFVNVVCGGLLLSKSMANRAILYKKYGALEIYSLSLEDVFLFKAASSREGDVLDCVNIIKKHELNWDVILKEYENQQSHLDSFYGFVVLDHLETVEVRSEIKIPIIKKLLSICLENAVLFAVKEKPKTIREILSVVDFPEYRIRNTLNKLVKKNRVKKIKGKVLKFKMRMR